jgi:multidrug efflux system membrane fusion protein
MAASKRRFRWGFVVLGIIVLALFAWAIFHKAPAKPQKAPTVSVSTAAVVSRDIQLSIDALGAAQPWSGVTIRAQVNGKLLSVAFHEGSDVRAGQLLAQIDPAPYEAALLQAQGALKRDAALLENAKLDLARYQKLAAQDSISGQQVDTQAALVKQDEGVVLIDKGQARTAAINLGYCKITSPTSGRAGVRLVDPGNLVSTSDTTGLVIINQIAPIAVTFTVPQGDFQRLSQASNGFQRPLPTQALSQETGALLDTGDLSIADNHVDPSTGTVALKARFPNAEKRLWPGQFVNVRLTVQTLSHATTIPAAAINQGPAGAYVYLVGADNKVSMRPITVAATQDATAVIKSGLNVGDVVVTDGQMSLRPGLTVATHPAASSAKKPSA